MKHLMLDARLQFILWQSRLTRWRNELNACFFFCLLTGDGFPLDHFVNIVWFTRTREYSAVWREVNVASWWVGRLSEIPLFIGSSLSSVEQNSSYLTCACTQGRGCHHVRRIVFFFSEKKFGYLYWSYLIIGKTKQLYIYLSVGTHYSGRSSFFSKSHSGGDFSLQFIGHIFIIPTWEMQQ